MIIAIDGPAGAGKSTVARGVAARMGFVRIDTGALYRGVGLAASRTGVPPDDEVALTELLERIDLRFDGARLVLDGEDVSAAIRTQQAGAAASRYAAVPAVRAGLLALQRRLGRASDAVLEGRDIGTVVFPEADVKIYLTASPEVRAARRAAELRQRGEAVDELAVLDEIRARDAADAGRAAAPLRPASDAAHVDASALDVEGTVQACLDIVQRRTGHMSIDETRSE